MLTAVQGLKNTLGFNLATLRFLHRTAKEDAGVDEGGSSSWLLELLSLVCTLSKLETGKKVGAQCGPECVVPPLCYRHCPS